MANSKFLRIRFCCRAAVNIFHSVLAVKSSILEQKGVTVVLRSAAWMAYYSY